MTESILKIAHRDEIGDLLNSMGLHGDGAEVGVLYGENAEKILQRWKCARLFLVDPYVRWPDDIYTDCTNTVDYEEARSMAVARLLPYRNKFFIAEPSEQAVRMFENRSLDFVYLDANHNLEHITQDIQMWWAKVKPGGVFGGHDYYDRDEPNFKCGVKTAVDRWCKSWELIPTLCECLSWFVKKPFADDQLKA